MIMIARFKYNVFVFFERIRTKKRIKKLQQQADEYCWYIAVENNHDPDLFFKYRMKKQQLIGAKIKLISLQYD